MSACAVASVMDVAMWFTDMARKEDMYLQPQMLQRMLYIAQGSYAAIYHGRKLMPAVFVADETGPVEPNVMRVFEFGRPQISPPEIPPEVVMFLGRIWRKYSHHTTEYVNQQIKHHAIYRDAMRKGPGTEIPFTAMMKFFSRTDRKVDTVRTADGRVVQKWMPAAALSGKPLAKPRSK